MKKKPCATCGKDRDRLFPTTKNQLDESPGQRVCGSCARQTCLVCGHRRQLHVDGVGICLSVHDLDERMCLCTCFSPPPRKPLDLDQATKLALLAARGDLQPRERTKEALRIAPGHDPADLWRLALATLAGALHEKHQSRPDVRTMSA